jgi:hypothetical protein
VRESAKRKATVAASSQSPIATAPATAIIIRRFMSGRKRRRACQALGATNQPPARIATR